MLEYVPGNQPVLSHEGIISSSRNQLKPFWWDSHSCPTDIQRVRRAAPSLHFI